MEQLGVEPVTSWLWVRCPDHYATIPFTFLTFSFGVDYARTEAVHQLWPNAQSRHNQRLGKSTSSSQGVASLPHKCQPPLPSARQHPSYGDCLEVKREYYQNCSVLGCVTQCLQSAAHSCVSSSYRSSRLGLSCWDLYTMHRGGCLE